MTVCLSCSSEAVAHAGPLGVARLCRLQTSIPHMSSNFKAARSRTSPPFTLINDHDPLLRVLLYYTEIGPRSEVQACRFGLRSQQPCRQLGAILVGTDASMRSFNNRALVSGEVQRCAVKPCCG